MTPKPAGAKKPSLGEKLLQHLIVFVICVVFPGVTTVMAPASWLIFERNGDAVQCTARTCVFFVVPFKTQHVVNVTEIAYRERAGGTRRERRFGHTTNRTINVDGEGFLQIHGVNEQVAEVSVSPASLEGVADRAKAFLDAPSPGESSTTMFVIANWKFGAIMGGILTSFTVLYVVGYTLGAIKGVFMTLRNLIRIAPPEEL